MGEHEAGSSESPSASSSHKRRLLAVLLAPLLMYQADATIVNVANPPRSPLGGVAAGPSLGAMLYGHTRYADIRGAVPHLSDTMLGQRLRELEAEGIVTRAAIGRRSYFARFEKPDAS